MEWIGNKLVFNDVDVKYIHILYDNNQISLLEQLKSYLFVHAYDESDISNIEIQECEELAEFREELLSIIEDQKKEVNK